jgi:hypothetical protein
MRRIARWLVLGALGIFTATACSDPFGMEDVLGTWYTTSINGESVPGTVVYVGAMPDSLLDIQYDRWTFTHHEHAPRDRGECSRLWEIGDGPTSWGDCVWVVNSETKGITIHLPGWSVLEGAIDGDTMTLTEAGPGIPVPHVLVLRRE